ncbi:MAG: class I SAM-dependent methyltransferase [Planctomycetaceae bacterium]
MKCRFCQSEVSHSFVDLGHQPPSNAYLTKEQLDLPEVRYPLKAYVCDQCWLVQLPEHAHADELFTSDYAYFSSVSSSWVDHARRYVEEAIPRFQLTSDSLVVEVASNDGYLLQFMKQAGIPCVGIEPTASTAKASRDKGIETVEEFFGQEFAQQFVAERSGVDLLIGNNVLAHVPDLNDFVAGVAAALTKDGVATFEFPHLMRLVEGLQFDTIYHEHFSYLSFTTVRRLFAEHALRIFDVEELTTHGGSLRVYATPTDGKQYQATDAVKELLGRERVAGMQTTAWYDGFQARVDAAKNGLLRFLLDKQAAGETVVGYGAAAKGNTLLNYAGVRADLLPFVCDAASSKQGKFLPGSHIPIFQPDEINVQRPAIVVILPWNIADEVRGSLNYIADWGGRFARAIPEMEVLT